MPLQTPSPHRFIAPTPSTQPAHPKPKSNLRHATAAHTPKNTSELQFKKITPLKRFTAPGQKYNAAEISRARDGVEETNSSAPRAQRKFGRVESIEETSQSSPSRPVNDEVRDAVQTVEQDVVFGGDEEGGLERRDMEEDGDEGDDEMLFVSSPRSKRRRTSPPSPTSAIHILPTTPLPSLASHRFRLPPPQTPTPFGALTSAITQTTTTPATTTPAPPSRPHFILPPPPTSPQKPSKPLPEIFSPSRKTQKYVSGGLASTAQSWIIETANTGFAAQEQSAGGVVWGRDREDGVRLKVRMLRLGRNGGTEVECFPGSMLFVRGQTQSGAYNASRAESVMGGKEEDEEGIRVLLAGQGGARGSGGVRVCVGAVVGIRAPTWNIDVSGETWTVGVDWVLL